MDLLRGAVTSVLVVLVLCSLAVPTPVAEAGEKLTRIKARGKLRCRVSDGIQGFSLKDADGQWSGMDVDFCRALAAAVVGDSTKDFQPYRV